MMMLRPKLLLGKNTIRDNETFENTLMKIQGKNSWICCKLLGGMAIATLVFLSGILEPIVNFLTGKVIDEINQWKFETKGEKYRVDPTLVIIEQPEDELSDSSVRLN